MHQNKGVCNLEIDIQKKLSMDGSARGLRGDGTVKKKSSDDNEIVLCFQMT